MFWVAPIFGALIGGALFRYLLEEESPEAAPATSPSPTSSSPATA
jgi:hypothetical protein